MSGNGQLQLDVSRETYERLNTFVSLVRKWNPRINLVAKNTLSDVWQRHVADSAQLTELVDGAPMWLDIGSGGGFPGLVVAAIMQEHSPETAFTFVESDQRKCVFLKTAAREMNLRVSIITSRIEKIKPLSANVISARALAPLPHLLSFIDQHLAKNGVALLQKGENWRKELESAQQEWSFDCDVIDSKTDDAAVILKVANLKKN